MRREVFQVEGPFLGHPGINCETGADDPRNRELALYSPGRDYRCGDVCSHGTWADLTERIAEKDAAEAGEPWVGGAGI